MIKQSDKRWWRAARWGALLLWVSVWLTAVSCTDSDEAIASAPGGVTLQLSSSDLAVTTRADEAYQTAEYYMNRVNFFFYRSEDDAEPVYKRLNVSVAEYHEKSVIFGLSEEELKAVFPDGATTCTVYAVANMNLTEEYKELTDHSITTLKNLVPVSIANGDAGSDGITALRTMQNGDFAMDGTGTVTLDATSQTVSGSIRLERALAKLTLELSVASSVKDDNKNTYTPDLGSMVVTLNNSATLGVLDETARTTTEGATVERGFIKTSRTYKESTESAQAAPTRDEETDGSDSEVSDEDNSGSETDGGDNTDGTETSETEEEVTYTSYVQTDPFYSYPTSWTQSSTYGDTENEASFTLKIAWKQTNAASATYVPYYYQIPINSEGCKLERNHHYKIKLKVGMLGMLSPGDTFTIEYPYISYEVLDWGEDEQTREATLEKSHYVIADDNEYTLWNLSSKSFSYNSCHELEGVYLTSVSYESTYYVDNEGNPQTVYLYNTEYNSDDNTYTETSNYGTNDKNAQETYSTVVTYIKEQLKAGLGVTHTTTEISEGATGTVTFNFDVLKAAGLVYRPLTYTLVLLAKKTDCESLKTTVKIIQYPSKYLEYAAADNVFVNGYYARISQDGTTKTLTYKDGNQNKTLSMDNYLSYPFIFSGYSSVSGNDNYTGYYSSSDNFVLTESTTPSIDYGKRSTPSKHVAKYGLVNTSYEYVQGIVQSTLTFKNTLDVYVSAFTVSDNSFSVKNSQGTDESHTYVLGDSRVDGNFTEFDHANDGSYMYTGTSLYDYYVSGEKSGGNYIRYVKSWGKLANAIKVGGTTKYYDNIIAPVYKIQSSYGALEDAAYFEVAQKRCATYQEAGYPAGRWRLPTLAEIAFIISLQNAKVISALFVSASEGYWTASEGYYDTKNSKYYENGTFTEKRHWVRCVYDLWYWQDGDSKTHQHLPVYKYNPQPTFVSDKSSQQ